MNTRTIKKLLCLFLAIIMLNSIAIPAFAQLEAGDGSAFVTDMEGMQEERGEQMPIPSRPPGEMHAERMPQQPPNVMRGEQREQRPQLPQELIRGEEPVPQSYTAGGRSSRNCPEREALIDMLRKTDNPQGMQGFEGDYEITDPQKIVEIAVQFVTPPAVALRLLGEDSGTRAGAHGGTRGRSEEEYKEQALEAHAAFRSQLNRLADVPPGAMGPAATNHDIFSEHHTLFNGVFMRVAGYMIPQIAELPEVFAVYPNQRVYTTPVTVDDNNYPQTTDTSGITDENGTEPDENDTEPNGLGDTNGLTDNNGEISDGGGYGNEYDEEDSELNSFHTEASASTVPAPINPAFMQESRELFNVDYIHNTMGITGNNIRVAVLDTGIDHTHDEFVRFQDPSGYIRGQNFTDSPYGLMDIHGHGTHVSGSVIAIAPNVELWHYKVLDDGGSGAWDWIISGIEQAYIDDIDVINLSLGGGNTFSLVDSVINLAVLNGAVAVISAGNAGPGSYTVSTPGIAGLGITVASGTLGGQEQGSLGDNVSGFSSRGPVTRTHHIKPDITAPGHAVYSPVPWGYEAWSGTSMAAPHIAGVAALLLEQRPAAQPHEIKALMMNTASPLDDLPNASAFTVGAGRVEPIAALSSGVVTTVLHPIQDDEDPGVPFVEHTMASLSFGAVAQNSNNSMVITVRNISDTAQTFNISHNFTRNPGSATANVSSQSLTVPANSTGTVTFTLNIPNNATPGFYEGNITVNGGVNNVARLPFAAVVFSGASAVTVRTEQELRTALEFANPAIPMKTITLAQDITLTEDMLIVPFDVNITLSGTGRNITAAGWFPAIGVSYGAELIINGVNVTRTTDEFGDETWGEGIINVGTLTLQSGSISGHSGRWGGGVANVWGTFNMHGGTISGNTASEGGGVDNEEGIFNMTGGTISGNTAFYGGGVSIYVGTFNLNSGTIRDNVARISGGGIYIIEEKWSYEYEGDIYEEIFVGTFNMESGTISNNTAPSGGGIGIETDGLRTALYENIFNINAGATFANNTALIGRDRLDVDNALYTANISGTQWTNPFTQGFNNFDIEYTVGPPSALLPDQKIPEITSITPNAATVTAFSNIASGGGRTDAVFDVVGENLSLPAVEHTFQIMTDSDSWSWIYFSDISARFNSPTSATVTVSLHIEPNISDDARSASVSIRNRAVNPEVEGTLTITQEEAPPNIDVTDDFTDLAFRNAVLREIGKSPGARIYTWDLLPIRHLYISNRGIKDLAGIQHFTSLRELGVGENNLTTLDVSNLPALENLSAWNSNISTLTLGSHPNLRWLHIGSNNLRDLNVSNLTALETLYAWDNILTGLTLGNLPALVELEVSNNNLTTLNLSGTPLLQALRVDMNFFKNFDALVGLENTKIDVAKEGWENWISADWGDYPDYIYTPPSGFIFFPQTMTYVPGVDIEGISVLVEHIIPEQKLGLFEGDLFDGTTTEVTIDLGRIGRGLNQDSIVYLFWTKDGRVQHREQPNLRWFGGSGIDPSDHNRLVGTIWIGPWIHYATPDDAGEWTLEIYIAGHPVRTQDITGNVPINVTVAPIPDLNMGGVSANVVNRTDKVETFNDFEFVDPIKNFSINLGSVYTGLSEFARVELRWFVDGSPLMDYFDARSLHSLGINPTEPDALEGPDPSDFWSGALWLPVFWGEDPYYIPGDWTVAVYVAGEHVGGSSEPVTVTLLDAPRSNQAAPRTAPTMASRTPTSVTLNAIAGDIEYARSPGGEARAADVDIANLIWQPGLLFDNLTPNTQYFFFARRAQTATHNASGASPGRSIVTEGPRLEGTVTISGAAVPRFGQILTADTGGVTIYPPSADMGTLIFQWQRATPANANRNSWTNIPEAQGGTSSAYTIQQADIGMRIRVRVGSPNATPAITAANAIISSPTETVLRSTATLIEIRTDGRAAGDPLVGTYTSTYIDLVFAIGDDVSGLGLRSNNADILWVNSTQPASTIVREAPRLLTPDEIRDSYGEANVGTYTNRIWRVPVSGNLWADGDVLQLTVLDSQTTEIDRNVDTVTLRRHDPPRDVTRPEMDTPTITTDGRRIILTFDEPIAVANRPTAAQFYVRWCTDNNPEPFTEYSRVAVSVIEMAVTGEHIILTMAEAALQGQAIDIAYTGSTIRDLAGNLLGNISATPVQGTDAIALGFDKVLNVANTLPRLGLEAAHHRITEGGGAEPVVDVAIIPPSAPSPTGYIGITSVRTGTFIIQVSNTEFTTPALENQNIATIRGRVLGDGSILIDRVDRFIDTVPALTGEGRYIIDYENETITFIGPIRFAFTNNHITIPTRGNLIATIGAANFDGRTTTIANGTVPDGDVLIVNIATRLNNSTNASRQTLYVWNHNVDLTTGRNEDLSTDVNELRQQLLEHADIETLMRTSREWMDMFSVNYDGTSDERGIEFSINPGFNGRTVELANRVENFRATERNNHATVTNFNPFYASGVVATDTAFVPLRAIPTANVNLQARLRGCNVTDGGVFASAPFAIQVLSFANANRWTAGGVANFVEYNGARLGTDPRDSVDSQLETAVLSGEGPRGLLLEEHVNWLKASDSSIARWRTPNDGHTYRWESTIDGIVYSHAIIDGEPLPPRLYNHIDRATNATFRIIRDAESGLPAVTSSNFSFAQLHARQNTSAPNRTLGTIPHNNNFEFLVVNLGGGDPGDVHDVNLVLDQNSPPLAGTPHIVQTWTRVPGTAINIQSNWAGSHVYVRRAATATAPHGTIVGAVPRQIVPGEHAPVDMRSIITNLNINDLFLFNPATGRLTINPNIPNELIILGFARNSAIEISQNGNFWFAAGNTDIRPFLSGAGQGYNSIYVRLRGNANTAPSDALDISINLQTANISVEP